MNSYKKGKSVCKEKHYLSRKAIQEEELKVDDMTTVKIAFAPFMQNVKESDCPKHSSWCNSAIIIDEETGPECVVCLTSS